MSTDPQSLLSIAKCFSCYDPASPGESMELALLVQLVQQLNPTANTSPQALLAAGNCYLCYGTIGQTQIMKLGLLALLVNSSTGGKQLFTHFTDSSTSGVAATDLYSDSIPANTLTVPGQRILAEYVAHSTYGGSPYNANITISFAGQAILNNTLGAANPADYNFEVYIVMTGPTTARASVVENLSYGPASPSQTVGITTVDLTGLNFAQANILKFTATSSDGTQSVIAKQAYAQLLT